MAKEIGEEYIVKIQKEVTDKCERCKDMCVGDGIVVIDYFCPICKAKFWELYKIARLRIPVGFIGKTIEDKSVMQRANNYIANFSPGFNLLIKGRSGLGKTLLATLILRQLTGEYRNGDFFAVANYINYRQNLYDDGVEDLEEIASNTDLLVLDDLGSEHGALDSEGQAAYVMSRLSLLLKSRFDNKKTTIITTNLDAINLKRRYGDAVCSVLASYAVINMTGEINYRERVAKDLNSKLEGGVSK